MQKYCRTVALYVSKAFQGDEWYNISVEAQTCDCSDFENAERCKHLTALGIHRLKPFIPKTHPTFSQADAGCDFQPCRRQKRTESGLCERQFRFKSFVITVVGNRIGSRREIAD
jgi:hypothetical protein